MSNPERICPRPYTTEVNVNPQINNVIVQLRHSGGAQNLDIPFCQDTDVVGSLFAPNRKIKNQVLSGSRNFQTGLTSVSLVLPASH